MTSDEDEAGAPSLPLEHALLVILHQQRALHAVVASVEAIASEEEPLGDGSVNALKGKIPRLENLITAHGSLFKSVTGFWPQEFEVLCSTVCPTIVVRARSTRDPRVGAGRPPKLEPRERVLNAILYLRHNSNVRYESHNWNWSRTSLNDDVFFVLEIMSESLSNEISWPNANEGLQSRNTIPELPGCLGHIDGTLCRIRRPVGPNHKSYYNGRKKLYCFNNVVVVDHNGLFIYVAAGFAGSFHDARTLRATDLAQNWTSYFSTDEDSPDPVEYVLGDPGYIGMDQFILRRVDRREADGDGNPVVAAFN